MRLHYKGHIIKQEVADQFRAYFLGFKDLGTFTTAREAAGALKREQRELNRRLSAISRGYND